VESTITGAGSGLGSGLDSDSSGLISGLTGSSVFELSTIS